MKLIFLGAPGAGKGTQSSILCEKLNIPGISTGNIIREEMANKTELGVKAKEYVESGGLVPDELVINMIKTRLSGKDCNNGYILDGFPRTLNQAKSLTSMGVNIDKVINIDVSNEIILVRMAGRRVCSKCGNPYHIEFNRPKVDGLCDKCGNELIIRKDDERQTVLNRLEIYDNETKPLIDYYKEIGILETVDGNGTENINGITKQIIEVLGV